jgi:hypothetical protein
MLDISICIAGLAHEKGRDMGSRNIFRPVWPDIHPCTNALSHPLLNTDGTLCLDPASTRVQTAKSRHIFITFSARVCRAAQL